MVALFRLVATPSSSVINPLQLGDFHITDEAVKLRLAPAPIRRARSSEKRNPRSSEAYFFLEATRPPLCLTLAFLFFFYSLPLLKKVNLS